MNLVDIAIILLLIMGVIVGFKRGVIHQTVVFIGFFAVIVLSFILKNPVSAFMYKHLPFFNFGGYFKGVSVLNIILYEVIAFFLVFTVLSIIFRILLKLSSFIEKLLNATIILGIPSKLLGMVVGFLESYVTVFIILFVVSLPIFNFTVVSESKYAEKILNNTPILSEMAGGVVTSFTEIVDIKDKYEDSNASSFNQDALDVLIKNKIITKDAALELYKSNKINVKPSE